MGQNEISNLYRGPSIDASYQVSYSIAHFVPIINKHGHHRQLLFLIGQFLKIFYSEAFQEASMEGLWEPIRNNNCLWWPCLLMIGTK
jgi:hypothetical protein